MGKSKSIVFHFTTERMYPRQLGLSLDDSKRMWLKMFFADTETLECNLAMMQAANETYLGRGETSPRALTSLASLTETFARVQQRILGPDALADSTLTIFISLVN
ncbi:putative leucin zipper protein [Emericellopsis cladophorae]|uniref:Leucin zipper protein n=1 Tax=Emericellopsis cladophorae TaxID=2686198 RepID=A0A9P9XZ14_9HYPO|nr:putative leucin zipper protein [Emericellopsis cladophorae]KAI6779954.1 putative leucin zipper protein [Emericellopsis cladophorae]